MKKLRAKKLDKHEKQRRADNMWTAQQISAVGRQIEDLREVFTHHEILSIVPLRDYLAGRAVTGVGSWSAQRVAKYAYAVADAMLKERKS